MLISYTRKSMLKHAKVRQRIRYINPVLVAHLTAKAATRVLIRTVKFTHSLKHTYTHIYT